MADPAPGAVPFQEAIDYFRQKLSLPTRTWTDLWQGMHSRAFVVAGAQKEALIADLRGAVDDAIANGTTIEDFRARFDDIVAAHGWSYNGGRGWRTRVIFDTNLSMAYASGRWAQILRVAAQRPWLRYVHADGVRHPRPWHVAWSGTILRWDDTWWQTHYPPNGWGCHCYVQQLSDRDLARRGFRPSERAPTSPLLPTRINTPTGPVTMHVPEGIDAGFAYNVGEAAWGRGAESLALESHGPFAALDAPGAPPPVGQIPVEAPRGRLGPIVQARPAEPALRQALRDALGDDETVLADPTGGRVLAGQAIVDAMMADPSKRDGRESFFPFLPEVVTEPGEIRVGFVRSGVSGRVALRRRYLKTVQLGGRTVTLIVDADGATLSGLDFVAGLAPDALRVGIALLSRATG